MEKKKPKRIVDVLKFIEKYLGHEVTPSWFTGFSSRCHISNRTPSNMLFHEHDKDSQLKIMKFIEQIRNKHKSGVQITVVDKCKFYSDSRFVKVLTATGR